MIGILSSLDSILDIPIDEALQQLPLTAEIKSAILDKQGLPGEALECVINYEYWDLSGMSFRDLDPKLISEAYFKSITWAKEVLNHLE